MPGNWSIDEVEAIVADYFAMLATELSGNDYNKAEHNRQLQQRIDRNKGSIEFKHQNISAVLENFRQPSIAGYLPRQNYQLLLEQVVLQWLEGHPTFFKDFEDGPVLSPRVPPPFPAVALSSLVVVPPEPRLGEQLRDEGDRVTRFYRTDFVKRDAENRRLGGFGEEWVLEFERRRLHDDERRPDLARRIERISETRGDGAGYDIASFERDESQRLIEVKTTSVGKCFPFLVTSNEVRVSEREPRSYHLYRVFEFVRDPKVYILKGPLSETCRLKPTQYSALP
jgi:hypothetical protein